MMLERKIKNGEGQTRWQPQIARGQKSKAKAQSEQEKEIEEALLRMDGKGATQSQSA